MTSRLRDIPSVDSLLKSHQAQTWIQDCGHTLTVDAIRIVLEQVRIQYAEKGQIPKRAEIEEEISRTLTELTKPTLEPVINATGVVLHTNLGRAPLSTAAIQAANNISWGYSNLEYDLQRGRRGSRLLHAEALLSKLCGVEAALVVNNNAGALLLVLTALARRRSVVIARSQLVEIGGGFRVPDVMKQSGARLIEIGTTNRIHLSDYEAALQEKPALVLRAHRSNFQIIGFTSEPLLSEIAAEAHRAGVILVDDLGSGTLLDTSRFGLGHEPTVQESVAAGADLVCFSGDKLLGGPQAGIIIGNAELLDRLKKHPLARALRADKLCLAALSATLLHYLKDEVIQKIPIWQMISASQEQLKERAMHWAAKLGLGDVVDGRSAVGGGSLPGETLPTSLLVLPSKKPDQLLSLLRQSRPPIIARLEKDKVVLDPRTVFAEQEDLLLTNLQRLI
jgi:L-seryl-tRNA(Ser) seleniumtransferase